MSAAFRSMSGRLDGQARDRSPGPSLRVAMAEGMPALAANDNHRPAAHCMSALPPGAQAIIEPLSVINQAGRAHASRWRLRFAPRWRPEPDPLTGWTGGGDPLAQLELRFATRGAAERYCRSEGVPFEIRGLAGMRRSPTPSLIGEAPPRLCCSPTGPHALCCGNYPVQGTERRGVGTGSDDSRQADIAPGPGLFL